MAISSWASQPLMVPSPRCSVPAGSVILQAKQFSPLDTSRENFDRDCQNFGRLHGPRLLATREIVAIEALFDQLRHVVVRCQAERMSHHPVSVQGAQGAGCGEPAE